jgi:hypothetical protein
MTSSSSSSSTSSASEKWNITAVALLLRQHAPWSLLELLATLLGQVSPFSSHARTQCLLVFLSRALTVMNGWGCDTELGLLASTSARLAAARSRAAASAAAAFPSSPPLSPAGCATISRVARPHWPVRSSLIHTQHAHAHAHAHDLAHALCLLRERGRGTV